MAFFAKRPAGIPSPMPATKPPETYDDQWFQSYWDRIVVESGVSVDDQQNMLQLILFTNRALFDDQAENWFNQTGDEGARSRYEATACGPSETPAQKMRFLVQWNPTTYEALTGKLDKFESLLIQAGREHGRLRFFPSQCCGEPIEVDLRTGSPVCSSCGQRS